MLLSDLPANHDPLWNVLIRFLVALIVNAIIIRLIYFRYSRRRKKVFSFFLMGIMIFLVCILLKTVEIQLGVALGLFAIFAILRFRSEGLSLRDMSYFFTVIGVSVINAMATFYNPVRGHLIINLIIILSVLILEYLFNKKEDESTIITYDRLELLNSVSAAELLQDLSSRTHLKVVRTKIRKIDLIKKTCELEIFFES